MPAAPSVEHRLSLLVPLAFGASKVALGHVITREGKLAVLCLSPEAGMGVSDAEKRDRIGEDRITLYQRHARGEL